MINYPVPCDFIETYFYDDRNALLPTDIWVDRVEKLIATYKMRLEVRPLSISTTPSELGMLIQYIERLEMHIGRLLEEKYI